MALRDRYADDAGWQDSTSPRERREAAEELIGKLDGACRKIGAALAWTDEYIAVLAASTAADELYSDSDLSDYSDSYGNRLHEDIYAVAEAAAKAGWNEARAAAARPSTKPRSFERAENDCRRASETAIAVDTLTNDACALLGDGNEHDLPRIAAKLAEAQAKADRLLKSIRRAQAHVAEVMKETAFVSREPEPTYCHDARSKLRNMEAEQAAAIRACALSEQMSARQMVEDRRAWPLVDQQTCEPVDPYCRANDSAGKAGEPDGDGGL